MPSIRSGFGSDFVLKSEKIGIGSETPTNTLDIGGAIKGNLSIAGVATLTSYGGFVAQNQHINKASSIGFGTVGLQTGVGIITSVQYYETETGFTNLGGVHHGDDQYYNTLSEDLVIDEGQILNITSIDMVGFTTIGEYDPHSHQSHVCLGALEEVSVTNHFSVPCGGSNERKDNPIEGTVRFNDDLNTLEFFNGNEWKQFTYNQGQSGRGVFMGGFDHPTFNTEISYINISSRGNTQNFGEVTPNMGGGNAGLGNATRGLVAAGFAPSYHDVIEYITIASEGDSIDFGNLTDARRYASGASSSTRGVFAGGYSPGVVNVIDYVEISTVGNALDFGDLSQARQNMCYHTSSSSTRGIFVGGITPATVDTIDYITIASVGNATDFGNLTVGRRLGFNVSTQTRAVFAGGYNNVQSMDYITIASAGDAIDFGEMVGKRRYSGGACSDSHGGLGGF